MKKYNYLYITTNMINRKIYIGVHSTDKLNDDYLGSGIFLKKAIKKYGRQNFKKQILMFFTSIEDMNLAERDIVNEEFIKKRNTYNSELGGAGGKVWTNEMCNEMSKTQLNTFKNGRMPSMLGKKHTIEAKQKMKNNHADFSGKKNPMYGKNCEYKMTEYEIKKHRENISKSNKGKRRTETHKRNYSNYAKTRKWIVNKNNKISHTTSLDDIRLKSGDWILGKKWKIIES